MGFFLLLWFGGEERFLHRSAYKKFKRLNNDIACSSFSLQASSPSNPQLQNSLIMFSFSNKMSAINSIFTKGDVVEYHYKDNIFEATIMDVHLENGPNDPYYFISYVKPNGQKIEKQTTKEQVFVLSDDHPSSSVAKEQTQTEDELLQAAIAQSLAEAKIESDKANSRTTNNSTITVAQQEMNERMAAMAVASDRQTKKKQEEEVSE